MRSRVRCVRTTGITRDTELLTALQLFAVLLAPYVAYCRHERVKARPVRKSAQFLQEIHQRQRKLLLSFSTDFRGARASPKLLHPAAVVVELARGQATFPQTCAFGCHDGGDAEWSQAAR